MEASFLVEIAANIKAIFNEMVLFGSEPAK